MPILYNPRYRTHNNEICDGLMRLGGLIVFAASILVMTFTLYLWGC